MRPKVSSPLRIKVSAPLCAAGVWLLLVCGDATNASGQTPRQLPMTPALELSDRGLQYLNQRQYREAEEVLRQAVERAEHDQDFPALARALNNLVSCYLQTERAAMGEPLAQRSVTVFRKLRDPNGEGEGENNLAIVYMDTNRYDEALLHMSRALDLHTQVGRLPSIANKLVALARLLEKMGQPREALVLLDTAQQIGDRLPDPLLLAKIQLARAYALTHINPVRAYLDAQRARQEFNEHQVADGSAQADRLLRDVRWQLLFIASALVLTAGLLPDVIRWTYRRRDKWLALLLRACRFLVPPVTSSDPLENIEQLRRRTIRTTCLLIIAEVLGAAYVLIVGPRLHDINEAGRFLASWPLPIPLTLSITRSLHESRLYVIGGLVLDILLFVVWLFISIEVVERLHQLLGWIASKIMKPPRAIKYNVVAALARNHLTTARWLTRALPAVLLLIWMSQRTAHVRPIGLALVILVTAGETWRFVRDFRLIHSYGPVRAADIYNSLHPPERAKSIAIFLALIVYAYALMPAFLIGLGTIQARVTYQGLDTISSRMASLVFNTAIVYHTLFLPDDFLVFQDLKAAYNPTASALEQWRAVVKPMLPYLFSCATIMTLFGMVLPWACSRFLKNSRKFWHMLALAILSSITPVIFSYLADLLFDVHLDQIIGTGGMVLWAIVWLILFYVARNVEDK